VRGLAAEGLLSGGECEVYHVSVLRYRKVVLILKGNSGEKAIIYDFILLCLLITGSFFKDDEGVVSAYAVIMGRAAPYLITVPVSPG